MHIGVWLSLTRVGGPQAARIGLVLEALPQEDVVRRAMALAHQVPTLNLTLT